MFKLKYLTFILTLNTFIKNETILQIQDQINVRNMPVLDVNDKKETS